MSEKYILVMMGLQGVGKSTISSAFAKKYGAIYLTADSAESAIIKSGSVQERCFESGLGAYLVIDAVADENLSLGKSVVVDAANYVYEAWEMWKNLADRTGASIHFVECTLEEVEHKKRIEERCRNLFGLKEIVWEDVLRRISETEIYQGDKLTIDTALPVSDNLKKIAEFLDLKC